MNTARRTLVACLTATLLAGHAHAAEPTKQEAVKMVEKAIAFLKSNGKDKTIAAINTKDGDFHQGSLYVTIFDLSGTLLAIPTNPKLVGKNLLEVPDPDGKLFRKEFIATASANAAGGWVDYKYKNPESGKVEPKTTFVQKSGDLVFASGVYK